jgi:hypothetical protein
MTLLSGTPEFIFTSGKFACVEFDYSNALVKNLPLEDYLDSKGEDYKKDWPDIQKGAEQKFVEKFNDENKDGMLILSNVKRASYKIIVHVNNLNLRKISIAKTVLLGPAGQNGSINISAVIDIIDISNNNTLCQYQADNISGSTSYKFSEAFFDFSVIERVIASYSGLLFDFSIDGLKDFGKEVAVFIGVTIENDVGEGEHRLGAFVRLFFGNIGQQGL